MGQLHPARGHRKVKTRRKYSLRIYDVWTPKAGCYRYRIRGTKPSQPACGVCASKPAPKVVRASYPDEHGNKNSLCGPCARAAGSWTSQNPCPNHPMVQANYPDQNGKQNSLCAGCAYEAGTLAKPRPMSSRIACEFFDRYSRLTGKAIEHVHFEAGQDPVGRETLVPGTRYRPDGRDPCAPTILYEFLGNRWHGYPPSHPDHNKTEELKSRYDSTFERFEVLASLGYTVCYVWEHEYKQTTRVRCPRGLESVVHTYRL